MLGAIAGDVVGSTREFNPIKTKAFDLLVDDSHITDDSVLTIAVGMAIAGGLDLAETLRAYAREGIGHVQLVLDPITRESIEGFAAVLAELDRD